MNLKPQDVVVALKLFGYPNGRPAMSIVASDLGLSPSEVHGAIQRLRSSKLLHGPALRDKPNISGLEEFLVHGLKYAFPAEHGEVTTCVQLLMWMRLRKSRPMLDTILFRKDSKSSVFKKTQKKTRRAAVGGKRRRFLM